LRLVGFCGKIYPLLKRYEYTKNYFGTRTWELKELVYDYDRAFDLITAYKEDGIYRKEEIIKALFDFMRTPYEFDELFVELGAPCFYIHPSKFGHNLNVTINPVLKDLKFYQVFDAFSTFQEISRYLGNVLTNREKMIPISDKHRIAQHGFDKHSFRHPTRLKDLK
jgi:hypothetical protein